jgi:branched-chain amino acid transport system permease protein
VSRPEITLLRLVKWLVVIGGAIFLAVAPQVLSNFDLRDVLTQALWLGIAAASLIFLAGYGGMVSLAQTALYGIAGFALGNFVAADGGAKLAWDPWLGVVMGLLAATAMGLVFGAVASRSEGIYFLMITLAFAVIVFYFWGAVTSLSGFGGLNAISRPALIGNPATEPTRLYYVTLVAAAGVYLLLRYVVRTPFGLVLQGVRDDPTRMRALGYNVVLHRTLAFGFGAFVAGIAGVLNVWWATRIDPNSINLGATLDLLIIAVIGGLLRIEGAWIGALAFVLLETKTRGTELIGTRFNTLIGCVFLVIVLLSPGGLVGIWEWANARLRRLGAGGPSAPAPPGTAAQESGS